MRNLLLIALVIVAACGGTDSDNDATAGPDPTDPPTAEALTDLDVTGGCGDALFYAANVGGSNVVTVWAPEVFAAASAEPTEIELPAEGVAATLMVGTAQEHCDDVQEPETRTDAEYAATAGHVTITIDFPPDYVIESQSFVPATIALDGIEFENGARLDHQEWSTEIGWYAG